MARAKRRPITNGEAGEIVAMRKGGAPITAIAKAMGRATSVVSRVLSGARTKGKKAAKRRQSRSFARIETAALPTDELERLRALVERLATRYPKILIEIL